MPTRFKEPPTIQRAPQYTGELPEIPLPAHPTLGKEPLVDAKVSEDAPHPIGVDPSVTGAFSTISAEDGTAPFTVGSTGSHERIRPSQTHPANVAAIPVRGRHGAEPERRGLPKVALVLIVAIAACLIVGGLLVLRNLVAADAEPIPGEGQRIEQSVVAPGQPIYYDSYAYTLLQQTDGRWSLVRSAPTGSDPLVVCTLDGDPVDLVFHHGTFLVPENVDGGWDIAAWTMGDGAIVTTLMNADGVPFTGEGRLSSATLEDETLTVTADDGTVTAIPLDF